MAINQPPINPKTKSKINPLILMTVGATFLGLIAAFGIWQYLSQTQQKVKELTVTRAVVVAAKQIQAGAKLTEQDLAIKQVPAQTIPKDYPSSPDALKGRVIRSTLEKDEVVTESRLIAEGAAGGLPMVIPQGHRAITIQVNEVIGVGGFVNPGDHVDILSVFNKKEEQLFSKTILQNVLILAVGDKVLDPNLVSDPQPKIVSQVTIALTPEDSEKIALASQSGELQLVLRPHGDEYFYETEGAGVEDVYGYLPGPPSGDQNLAALAASSSKTPQNFIEVILGDQKTVFYY